MLTVLAPRRLAVLHLRRPAAISVKLRQRLVSAAACGSEAALPSAAVALALRAAGQSPASLPRSANRRRRDPPIWRRHKKRRRDRSRRRRAADRATVAHDARLESF